MAISMDQIKKLREKTGAGVMDAKRALEESGGDMKKAEDWIAKKGLSKAESKEDRETAQGVVYSYVHHDGKSGALVKLLCETDFVARTEDFVKLAKELAMQATSMQAESVEELLEQAYVRDPKITVRDLVKQTAGKVGENIQLAEISQMRV
jgi:elongation factor Ts